MKKLLTEYFALNYDNKLIAESKENNNGRIILSGIFQVANKKNQNGRIYPKEILMREVENYLRTAVEGAYATGEIDHPQTSVVELKNVSHRVLSLDWKGDEVWGKMEVLNTPAGKTLQGLLEGGVRIGISSRAVGSTRKDEGSGVEIVSEDLELICFDAVSQPSVSSAFLNLHESKVIGAGIRVGTKEQRIYRALQEILNNGE